MENMEYNDEQYAEMFEMNKNKESRNTGELTNLSQDTIVDLVSSLSTYQRDNEELKEMNEELKDKNNLITQEKESLQDQIQLFRQQIMFLRKEVGFLGRQNLKLTMNKGAYLPQTNVNKYILDTVFTRNVSILIAKGFNDINGILQSVESTYTEFFLDDPNDQITSPYDQIIDSNPHKNNCGLHTILNAGLFDPLINNSIMLEAVKSHLKNILDQTNQVDKIANTNSMLSFENIFHAILFFGNEEIVKNIESVGVMLFCDKYIKKNYNVGNKKNKHYSLAINNLVIKNKGKRVKKNITSLLVVHNVYQHFVYCKVSHTVDHNNAYHPVYFITNASKYIDENHSRFDTTNASIFAFSDKVKNINFIY